MQNKKVSFLSAVFFGLMFCSVSAYARDLVEETAVVDVITEQEPDVIAEEEQMEQMSADAVAEYNPSGTLFQQITDLEQEKVLMQLVKERAQLDLDLDRLAAEKIKLHMEIDTLSGRAEQQQQELEAQKAKLDAELARLEAEKQSAVEAKSEARTQNVTTKKASESSAGTDLSDNYRLVNVIGAGAQLQATVESLSSGQTKRISVGKNLDGWTVKSISLEDGVVFVGPDGETQNLNISNGK
jgi:type IV pilus biogenesis protein PilP